MDGFCSFCGSTTVLNSRIEKTLRPDYIIPFQKTKEELYEKDAVQCAKYLIETIV